MLARWRAWLAARRSTWKRGERLAQRHLQSQGYKTLATNLKLKQGEIDLLMLAPDRRTIVVVEVKARASSMSTERVPEAAITRHKQNKLVSLASSIARREVYRGRPIRIDVVAVELPAGAQPTIRHHVDTIHAG